MFPIFLQISVEEQVVCMVGVCGSYFPQVGIHLRQDQ